MHPSRCSQRLTPTMVSQSCAPEGVKNVLCAVALDDRAESVCQAAVLVAAEYGAPINACPCAGRCSDVRRSSRKCTFTTAENWQPTMARRQRIASRQELAGQRCGKHRTRNRCRFGGDRAQFSRSARPVARTKLWNYPRIAVSCVECITDLSHIGERVLAPIAAVLDSADEHGSNCA